MDKLLCEIRSCQVCTGFLPNEPRPIVQISRSSRIVIIGQAPGRKVQDSGVPWDDPSGDNLRAWLGVDKALFYDEQLFALVPMGFCYPGKGKSGDLPPRPECAPLWHPQILHALNQVSLTLLIGQYAQGYYLADRTHRTLTETVRNYQTYLPDYFVLPHPSPRNNIWQNRNSWFRSELLPRLRNRVDRILRG